MIAVRKARRANKYLSRANTRPEHSQRQCQWCMSRHRSVRPGCHQGREYKQACFLGTAEVVVRGGQTFPKCTEIRNSVALRAYFSVFFRPCFPVVAESVSEQLLQRTGRLRGQFWLSKESVSTSTTDYRIPTPICTKYGLQKVRTCKIDGLYR